MLASSLVYCRSESRFTLFPGELWHLLLLLLFEEAFIKVMKLSVSILEVDSAHLCHLQLCFSIDRIRSIYGHKQILMTSYVMEIACIYMH